MSSDLGVTDPAKYNERDLLLFLQLLHTNELIDPASINKSNATILKKIAQDWYDHQSTQLSKNDGLEIKAPWTTSQLIALYNSLLDLHPDCKNTTDLANKLYQQRIQYLESTLKNSQSGFHELLSQSQEQQ